MQDRKAAGYEGSEEEGGVNFFSISLHFLPPILHILPLCDPAYPVFRGITGYAGSQGGRI